jgi:hypothetical protein
MLSFSLGNGKLKNDRLIFNLPAGRTCPGAKDCKAWVSVDGNDKRKIVDGPDTEFRCFAASSEVLFPAVFNSRKSNLDQVVQALKDKDAIGLVTDSIAFKRTKKVTMVRIHESGDFFSKEYFVLWCIIAEQHPELKFYAYTKSLKIVHEMRAHIPANLYITASYGGQHDDMIDAGMFPRYAKVFKTEAEAAAEGLEVDHDDSHCFGDGPFALLVHGQQPAGSDWGKAIRDRRKAGQFAGYNAKNKVTT